MHDQQGKEYGTYRELSKEIGYIREFHMIVHTFSMSKSKSKKHLTRDKKNYAED